MIEVLMYLFENYMEKDTRIMMEKNELASELRQVGYMKSAIEGALQWLAGLNQPLVNLEKLANTDAVRVYHPIEKQCLGIEGINLLAELQQKGVLTATQRELVIDRALAMGRHDIGERKIKWIALMVLFGHSKDRNALIWMQDFVFNQDAVKH